MDITTDSNGAADGLDVGFAEEDLSCLITESLDVIFRELLALAEMRDPRILLRDIDHCSVKTGRLEYAEQS